MILINVLVASFHFLVREFLTIPALLSFLSVSQSAL